MIKKTKTNSSNYMFFEDMVSSGKINKAGSALGLIVKGIAVFSMLSATFIFLKDVDFRISFRDVNWAKSAEVVQLVLFSGFMFCLFCALFCNFLYFISSVLMFLELNFRKEDGGAEYGAPGSSWQENKGYSGAAEYRVPGSDWQENKGNFGAAGYGAPGSDWQQETTYAGGMNMTTNNDWQQTNTYASGMNTAANSGFQETRENAGVAGSGGQQESYFGESSNPSEDENYEYVDNETMQVRMQMIPLRVKIIDTLNLFVANLQMIPLIFLGLFFVVGGIAIVFQDNNPAFLILSLMGIIPIVASIISFRRDIQRFKEKYFGIVVKAGSPMERKQKLMDRLPSLMSGGFFVVVGIFVLTINTPEDMSLTANILVRLSGGLVMAIGVFVAILVTKKK